MNDCQVQSSQSRETYLEQELIPHLPQIQSLSQKLILAIFAGFLFQWLHIPVSWLLGPMAAGILCATLPKASHPLPSTLVLIARAILGLVAASRFSPETASIATTYAFPLVLCILLSGGLSLFNGYLLGRWAGIDRTTSILGSIPGAAFGIVAMSEEMGADAIAVALLQYIRVLLVVAVVPTFATIIFPSHVITPEAISLVADHSASTPLLIDLPLLALSALLGTWGGSWLRLPAASFLGTFFIGLPLFWLRPDLLYIPQWLFLSGLTVVGLSIGLRFDWDTAQKLLKATLIEVGLVIVLIFCCMGIAYEFHTFTHVDTMTAVLGFTPGGIEAMVATTIQLGGDTGLVLAIQMTRMFAILSFGPWLVRFLVQRARRRQVG